MTRQEKKDFLHSYWEITHNCKSLTMELEKLQTLATHITANISPVPGGGNGNKSKIEECAIRIVEIETKLEEELGRTVATREAILKAIESLPRQYDKTLIRYRYINCLSYSKIAEETGVDERWVRRKINKAIDNMKLQ